LNDLFLALIAAASFCGRSAAETVKDKAESRKQLQISPIVKMTIEVLKNVKCYREREKNSRGYLLPIKIGIECSTFYSCRVAKLSSGLFPLAFVITVNKFMNGTK
jgi:hypothetical protein